MIYRTFHKNPHANYNAIIYDRYRAAQFAELNIVFIIFVVSSDIL